MKLMYGEVFPIVGWIRPMKHRVGYPSPHTWAHHAFHFFFTALSHKCVQLPTCKWHEVASKITQMLEIMKIKCMNVEGSLSIESFGVCYLSISVSWLWDVDF